MTTTHPDGEAILCRRCGREIVASGDRWTHLADDGDRFRGCRAASFTDATGWDDTIDRTWKATAPKGISIYDVPDVSLRRFTDVMALINEEMVRVIAKRLDEAVAARIITAQQAAAIEALGATS